jgi:hypothetical protein
MLRIFAFLTFPLAILASIALNESSMCAEYEAARGVQTDYRWGTCYKMAGTEWQAMSWELVASSIRLDE